MWDSRDPNHWACSDCGNVQSNEGACTRCRQEPLNDLRNENVRLALSGEDDARRSKVEARNRMLAVVLAVVIEGVLCAFSDQVLIFAMSFFFGGFIVMGLGLAVVIGLLLKSLSPFRPYFPQLRT